MEYTPGSVVASQFRQACIDFDIKNGRKVADLTRTLDATAQALVPSIAIRYVHLHIRERRNMKKERENAWKMGSRSVMLLRWVRGLK